MSRFLNSNRIHSQTRPKWKMNYLWCSFLCRCECRPDERDRDRLRELLALRRDDRL